MNKAQLELSVDSYLKDEEKIKKEIENKKIKVGLFQKTSVEQIKRFNSESLFLFLKDFCAFNSFYNKKYLIDQAFEANGIETIKKYIVSLLQSNNIEKEFDDFNRNLKYFGPSLASELLSYYNCGDFFVWNGCTLKAFQFLEEDNIPAVSSKLTGKQYLSLIKECEYIKDYINKKSKIKHEMIDIDCYFRYIYHNILGLY